MSYAYAVCVCEAQWAQVLVFMTLVFNDASDSNVRQQQQQVSFNEKSKQAAGPDINGLLFTYSHTHTLSHTHMHTYAI